MSGGEAAILDTESTRGDWLLHRVSHFYKHFHRKHRFANASDWVEMDRWVSRQVRSFLRRFPKNEPGTFRIAGNTLYINSRLTEFASAAITFALERIADIAVDH